MHHIPTGVPVSARVAEARNRWALHGLHSLKHRGGRLGLSAMVSTVITALVLAVPVVDGSGDDSPVGLGEGGRPVSSDAFAGLTTAGTYGSATARASASAGGPTAGTAGSPTSGSVPVASAPSEPAPSTTAPEAASGPAADAPSAEPAPAVEPAPSDVASADRAPVDRAPVDRAPAPPVDSAPAAPAPSAPAAREAPSAAAATAAREAPSSPAAPAAPAAGGATSQVAALVNAERASAGCRPLVVDTELATVARAHSEDLRDRGISDPDGLDAVDPEGRAERAEVSVSAGNVAVGQQDAAAVVRSWMGDSGARADILDCDLTRVGVGIAHGDGGPWWTQLFD